MSHSYATYWTDNNRERNLKEIGFLCLENLIRLYLSNEPVFEGVCAPGSRPETQTSPMIPVDISRLVISNPRWHPICDGITDCQAWEYEHVCDGLTDC